MRVISGSARGRHLAVPPGRAVRPTSDRVREALFSSLADDVPDAVVLDLYAGSGALAIEALSRGAQRAVLVERDRRIVAVLRGNLERTGVADRARVVEADAARFCHDPRDGPFDVVLLDPPYAEPLAAVYTRLDELHAAGGVAPGAVVVVERPRRDPALEVAPPAWLAVDRRRSYGDTVLLYFREQGGAPWP